MFDIEPLAPGSPLLMMENVILSSQIATVSPKADYTSRETAVVVAASALRGELYTNVVRGMYANQSPIQP
jgi:phosphoglycerate dehydrogenase-like enzyme